MNDIRRWLILLSIIWSIASFITNGLVATGVILIIIAFIAMDATDYIASRLKGIIGVLCALIVFAVGLLVVLEGLGIW
jgi:hypothetical protein